MSNLLAVNGCSPGKFNTKIMEWNPGSLGASVRGFTADMKDVNGNFVVCNYALVEYASVMYTNLASVGISAPNTGFYNSIGRAYPDQKVFSKLYIGGRDTGFPLNDGTALYFYFVKQISTGICAWLASQSIIYDGVTLPAGWMREDTLMRKAQFGCVYNSNWDGIPYFTLLNWPMPCVRFTVSEEASPWMALYADPGYNSTWTALSLAGYLPDNARVAFIACEVRLRNGFTSGASAYVRSNGIQGTGLGVGSVFPNSPSSRISPMGGLPTDSNRNIWFRCDNGAALYINVLGYSMTDPS